MSAAMPARRSAHDEAIPTRAHAYLRISRDEAGDELGVQRQKTAILEAIAARGWTLGEVFCDNDISAYTGRKRPGYEALWQTLEPGDAIVVTEVTRLTRGNLRHIEDMIDRVEHDHITILALRAGQMDLSTSAGRAMARMGAVFARMESEQLGERVAARHDQRARAGLAHGGLRPFGYDRTPDGGLTINEPEAAVIRRAVDLFLGGTPLTRVVTQFVDEGVPTASGKAWRVGTLADILRSPRIAGLRPAGGEIVGPANWEPIIDRARWEQMQARLTVTKRGRPSTSSLLAGLGVLSCGVCGAPMHRHGSSTRGVANKVYACDKQGGGCGSNTVTEERVDELVIEQLLEYVATYKHFSREIARLEAADTSRIAIELAEDEQRLADLAQDYASRAISRAEWQVAREIIDARVKEAKAMLARTTDPALPDRVNVLNRKVWDRLALDQRRALIRLLISSVVVSKGKPGRAFDRSRVTITLK